MDHAEALQMRAVERYVLGDLSASEVDGFERHFFDCPQCSEELRILSVLQENARAVFIEQTSTPSNHSSAQPVSEQKAGRRWSWAALFSPAVLAPALAMLAVAVFLGYQAGERKTSDPQALNAYPLYAASRGAETVVSPPNGARFFTLYMDRTWDRDFASYRAVVRDDSGKAEQSAERASLPLNAPQLGQTIQVLFPSRALAPGRYVLSILGKDNSGQEIKAADYSFTLRFQ